METCLVFCVHGKVEGSPFEIRGSCFFVHGAEVLVPLRRLRRVCFHLALRRSVPPSSPFHFTCTFRVVSLRRFVASWGGVPVGSTTVVRPIVSVDRWIHRKGIPSFPSLALSRSLSLSDLHSFVGPSPKRWHDMPLLRRRETPSDPAWKRKKKGKHTVRTRKRQRREANRSSLRNDPRRVRPPVPIESQPTRAVAKDGRGWTKWNEEKQRRSMEKERRGRRTDGRSIGIPTIRDAKAMDAGAYEHVGHPLR